MSKVHIKTYMRQTTSFAWVLMFTCAMFFASAQTSEASLTDGLLARWTFDQGKMSPNVRDSSGQGYHGSLSSGFTPTTTTTGRLGQALTFDGNNDYMTTSLAGPTVFTISGWIKYTTVGAYGSMVSSPTNSTVSFDMNQADGQLRLVKTNVSVTGQSTRNVPAGVWAFVAVTYAANGDYVFYINGTPAGSGNSVTAFATGVLCVGIHGNNGAFNAAPFKGSMDDVRVYNRVLGAGEIAELYRYRGRSTINATSQAFPDLNRGKVGHWTFDGKDMYPNVRDVSGNGNHGQLTGFTATTTTWGQVGQALTFNGSQYAQINDAASLRIASALTISAWAKPSSFTNYMIIAQKRDLGTSACTSDYNYGLWVDQTTGKLLFEYCNGGSYGVYYSTKTLSATTWQHVTVAIDETANTLTFYINGVPETSQSFTGTMPSSGTDPLQIGYYSWGSVYGFKGALDDVRIYNRALSAQEVKLLYGSTASGKANVTLPMPKIGQGGLVGHWTFDGKDMYPNVRDKSGQGNHGQLSGFTATTSTWGKVGQALIFDGSNDVVNAPSISAISGASKVTMSGWYKRSAAGADMFISAQTTSNSVMAALFLTGGNLYFQTDSSYGYVAQNDTKWHHVVAVYDGTQTGNANRLKIYLDGVPQTLTFSGTIPATLSTLSRDFTIGRLENVASYYANGTIDDVRVYTAALSAAEVKQLYKSATSVMQ